MNTKAVSSVEKKTFVNLKRVCVKVALRLKTIIPFMNKKKMKKNSNPGSRLVARIVKKLHRLHEIAKKMLANCTRI